MKEVLIKEYNNLKKTTIKSKIGDYVFKLNFINNSTLEILGEKEGKFNVQFINQDNGKIVYETTITNNTATLTCEITGKNKIHISITMKFVISIFLKI